LNSVNTPFGFVLQIQTWSIQSVCAWKYPCFEAQAEALGAMVTLPSPRKQRFWW
jgi:hypothetical protein